MLRSLYELSTGNNDVAALYWSEPAKSLLAITTCPHIDNYMRGKDYEDVIDGGDCKEPYRWPKQAKHGVKDFEAQWDAGNHVLIRYAFSGSPTVSEPIGLVVLEWCTRRMIESEHSGLYTVRGYPVTQMK
jgi:hypothetical protein